MVICYLKANSFFSSPPPLGPPGLWMTPKTMYVYVQVTVCMVAALLVTEVLVPCTLERRSLLFLTPPTREQEVL